ncbi:MAG: ABC transporter permease [Erysipelotrichaceae bacterium]|nr:ABC transporter permease [Erysipelotrichaceae bacterium]
MDMRTHRLRQRSTLRKIFDGITKTFQDLYQNRKSAFGFSIVLFFVIMAIAAMFVPDLPIDVLNKFAAPTTKHLLGTDHLGRDLLLMLIAGSRDVLSIAFLTGVFTVTIGTVLGLVSGIAGGMLDRILQFITNLFLTVPSFPILLILSTMIVIKDVLTFAIVLSVWSWAGLSRMVRAQIISLKERDFIQICNVMGMKRRRIIFRELLPNSASYIAVNFITIMRGAITGSVGIMMLGLAALDTTNWGTMLYLIFQNGFLVNPKAIYYILSPIICIFVFQLGIVLLASGVDEIVNPRLRKN